MATENAAQILTRATRLEAKKELAIEFQRNFSQRMNHDARRELAELVARLTAEHREALEHYVQAMQPAATKGAREQLHLGQVVRR